MTDEAVYGAEGDPANVLVMHRFGCSPEAHTFLESPELRQAMQEAGVDAGSLRFEFYDEA